jgi:SSS family solute:Na+ symporter
MHTVDLLVVGTIILITFVYGLWMGRNIKELRDYALGDQKYSSFTICATLSASYIGGGYTFGLSEKVYIYGLDYIICLLGFSLQLIFVALLIAPKISRFINCMSAGDIMFQLYGKSGRLITGFAGVLICIGIIGAQISATGYVFNLFLGMDKMTGILIGCGIVILYATFGGMKAVVATDIIQFIILIVAIPVTLFFGVDSLGGPSNLMNTIPHTHHWFSSSIPPLTLLVICLSLVFGEALTPPYLQRLLLSKKVSNTVKGTLFSGILSIPFFFITGTIGLVALSMNADLNPNLSMLYVIKESLPIGVKGMAIAGIISVVMSSADSYLNSASVTLIHDILPSLKIKVSAKKELNLMRWATALLGVGAISFALAFDSVLDILLYSYGFWSPLVLPPLVGGILGFKITQNQFLICVAVGMAAVLLSYFFVGQSENFEYVLFGFMANSVSFIVFVLKNRLLLNR